MTTKSTLLLTALLATTLAQSPCTVFGADESEPAAEKTEVAKESDSIEDLFAALTESIDATTEAGKPILTASQKRSLANYIARAQRYLDASKHESAMGSLDSAYSYAPHPPTAALLGRIRRKIAETEKAHVAHTIENAKTLMASAAARCADADTEKDVYALMAEVEATRNALNQLPSAHRNQVTSELSSRLSEANSFLRNWRTYAGAIEDEEYPMALQQIRNMLNSSSYRLIPRKTLRTIEADLQATATRHVETKLDALRTSLKEVGTEDAARKAHLALRAMQQDISRSGSNSPYYQELSTAVQAMTYWMQVLGSEADEDYTTAMQNIRNLESGTYRNTLILKRTTILAKKAQLTEKILTGPSKNDPLMDLISKRVDKITSAEGLITFSSDLTQIINSGAYPSSHHSQELQAFRNDVNTFGALYSQFKAGKTGGSLLMSAQTTSHYSTHRWAAKVSEFRKEMTIGIIAKLCQLKKVDYDEARDDPESWLLTLADDAADAGKWLTVHTILDTYRIAFAQGVAGPAWLSGELQGCKSYLVAKNFDDAGEIRQAISDYRNVLRQIGERLPRKLVQQRLQVLREAHPEEYKDADETHQAVPPVAVPGVNPAIPLNHLFKR